MEEIEKLHSWFIYPVVTISLFLLWSITKWWLISKPGGNKKKKLPPSPRKLPIIGNLHQLGSLPHRSLQILSKKHGPLMLLHFGSVPVLIVSSADGAREIIKTHDLNFANRPEIKAFKKLLYDGKNVSFAPYGEYWRQVKGILVNQLLSHKRVQSFRSIREEETAVLVEKIKDSSSSGKVNLSEMFSELAIDVICRSAFGVKCSDSENGRKFLVLLVDLLELFGTISIGDFVPSLRWITRVNGFDKRVDRVAKELDDFLEDVIQQHMEITTEEKKGQNFIDILLEIYNNDNKTADDSLFHRDSIKALVLDVFAGGTDAISPFLEWSMTEVLRNANVMEKLQNEVREIVGGKDENITDQHLEKMDYLKAVIKENFRCHPPSPFLTPRVAGTDVKIKGYDVSKGTLVLVNAWDIGRDPESWDDPEKFEPERFLKGSKNNKTDFKGLDFELIPFGSGRRGCPGISFAVATIELVLANLVHKFNWELPDGAQGKNLDMTERRGATIHRAIPLLLVATEK